MEKKFKFERLIVWELAMDWGEAIDQMTEKFPKKEIFNLSSQIRRAADSVALNIAEGSIGQSNPEQRRFVNYSLRSVSEVITCLHKASRREYISAEEFEMMYSKGFEMMNRLVAFSRMIK